MADLHEGFWDVTRGAGRLEAAFVIHAPKAVRSIFVGQGQFEARHFRIDGSSHAQASNWLKQWIREQNRTSDELKALSIFVLEKNCK